MDGMLAPLIGLGAGLVIAVVAVALIRRPRTPRETLPPGQRVVVVGGGFGGIQAVNKLRRMPVEVTLIDRRNFHLFQPLVYQVATGALSAAEVAAPLRAVLKREENVRVVLAEVSGFDLERRQVVLDHLPNGGRDERLDYDTLVVAGGSMYSYFGHDDWRARAPELKSLAGALDIRNRILTAFEAAADDDDPPASGLIRRQRHSRFCS